MKEIISMLWIGFYPHQKIFPVFFCANKKCGKEKFLQKMMVFIHVGFFFGNMNVVFEKTVRDLKKYFANNMRFTFF